MLRQGVQHRSDQWREREREREEAEEERERERRGRRMFSQDQGSGVKGQGSRDG